MLRTYAYAAALTTLLTWFTVPALGQDKPAAEATSDEVIAAAFLSIIVKPGKDAFGALAWIDENWERGMEPLAFDVMRFNAEPKSQFALVDMLQRKTGQQLELDMQDWLQWWWQMPHVEPHSAYLEFKRVFYSFLDHNFDAYFRKPGTRTIQIGRAHV